MNNIIRCLLTVIPMLLIYIFVNSQLEFMEWKTKKVRQIVGGILAIIWVIGFGIFTGYTGL